MALPVNYSEFQESLKEICQENFDLDTFMRHFTENYRNAQSNSSTIQKLFEYAKSNGKLKVNCTSIPSSVLPPGFNAELYDVRIAGRGPDDKIYSRNRDIREKITRGMTFLKLEENGQKHPLDLVIYANRKFTGAVGDEDEFQPENDEEWRKFCIEPPENSASVVCTTKLNGEAAHFAGRYINDQFYIFGGSKNVHMMFKNEAEIDLYTEPKFAVASSVAKAIWRFYISMEEERRMILEQLLHHTKVTFICEILQPTFQHIVNLSSYNEPLLALIAISASAGLSNSNLTAFMPTHSLILGQFLGMASSDFEVFSVNEIAFKVKEIRKRHHTEGCVLYYVTADSRTIGLSKVKTVWYTLLRALREKAAASFPSGKKNKKEVNIKDRISATTKRFDAIQKWLNFNDEVLRQWKGLAETFLKYLDREISQGKLKSSNLRPLFPIIWDEFLEKTKKSDDIPIE